MGPIYKFMNVCADFMVEQDVPDKLHRNMLQNGVLYYMMQSNDARKNGRFP